MTIIESIAQFSHDVRFDELPDPVVQECKRLLLDAAGCAVAGHDTLKGRAGVEFGGLLGGAADEATILGSPRRTSVFGAAFANGELINALEFDPILPPGHVTPNVLPGALAVGEREQADGRTLITALAVAHELSFRIGGAMGSLRRMENGKPVLPPVFGYSSTVFGATAAIGMLKGLHLGKLVDALGIAGLTAPVDAFRGWCMHTPPTTLKYLAAGVLAHTAMTAAHLAELGHRGNPQILDDAESGFPRYIGTERWEPGQLLDGLGEQWHFPGAQSYRPYAHARGAHGALDVVTSLVTEHDLKPYEIEAVRAWGEPFVATYPVWRSRELAHVQDALYSSSYALSLAAHRTPAGRPWQDPEVVFSPSVKDLANRCSYRAHPDYAREATADPDCRPTRVEVDARGTTFDGTSRYPQGSPSPDAGTTMSTTDIVTKFRTNTAGLLPPHAVDAVTGQILTLESVKDVAAVVRELAPPADPAATPE
ncbi:MmgE/PrpD family protein [Streptomyces sp. NPDC056983]|uniref:MmgE/PrpD family protein n=1 Tax=Streptomyces sp. NPDC056983 TaxID=3345987 RepID=UPI003631D2B3